MQNFNTEELKTKIGVYEIRNLVNGKVYIGSTIMSFHRRWDHHRSLLRGNTHKNTHLQRAWNKYGEDSFLFSILEVVDECCTLDVEQTYLDSVEDKYNINPLASGTPNMSKETIEKRSKTFTDTIRASMEYYHKVKDGEISIEEVPNKYLKLVEERLSRTPWNKGLTSKDVDYSHLKGIKKTVTEKVLKKRKEHSEKVREDFGGVFIYDSNFNFLRKFRSPKDIEEWSHTEENNLPIKSRFKGESRMGIPLKVLQSVNIVKSCNHLTSYKGLYFRREEIIQKLNLS